MKKLSVASGWFLSLSCRLGLRSCDPAAADGAGHDRTVAGRTTTPRCARTLPSTKPGDKAPDSGEGADEDAGYGSLTFATQRRRQVVRRSAVPTLSRSGSQAGWCLGKTISRPKYATDITAFWASHDTKANCTVCRTTWRCILSTTKMLSDAASPLRPRMEKSPSRH
jgi:hypothetical protein